MSTPNERIKRLREALHMTTTDFADMIGVSQPTMSVIERGARSVTEKHIRLILAAKPDVNAEWLRTGIGDMFVELDNVDSVCDSIGAGRWLRRLLHDYAALDEDSKAVFDSVVENLALNIADDIHQHEHDDVRAAIRNAQKNSAPPAEGAMRYDSDPDETAL